MTALGVGKTPVVIPRLARFHEHVDDHQLQITEAFAARGIVVRFADGDDIAERVDQAAAATGTPRRRRGDLVAAVARAASGAPRQRGRDDLPGVAEPARPPG
jgi:UDP-N-acetylglucosamine transferase subunit ALG13